MADESLSDLSLQRHRALSRWENEGGAINRQTRQTATSDQDLSAVPLFCNTEMVQLRIRVIALENLMIALLARALAEQLDLVREMAAYISPRPGHAPHRMTIHAAAQMLSLLNRSGQFRS